MAKLILDEHIRRLYAPSARYISTVNVPEFKFLMIDGMIEKNESLKTSESFQSALNVLSGLSFTLKFVSKLNRKNPVDYDIMPMEALWQMDVAEDLNARNGRAWTLMAMQPEHISQEMVDSAVENLRRQKGEISALKHIRYARFHEGKAIQIMHVGSQTLAPMTFERLQDYAKYKKYRLHGKYHEIYISDPRHEQPDKERTIIRCPIKETEK